MIPYLEDLHRNQSISDDYYDVDDEEFINSARQAEGEFLSGSRTFRSRSQFTYERLAYCMLGSRVHGCR